MQPIQEVKYSKQIRNEIKSGVDKTANAVKITLGPEGRNVVISKDNFQIFTKDGVTVAESLNFDGYEKIGNEAIKEAARKTNAQGGDGTTCVSILVQAMVGHGFSAIDSGISPISLVKGIKKAVEFVNNFLDKIAKPIKDYDSIKNVASISANDVEMGTHIANLFHKIGPNGVIVVEESKSVGYEEEFVEGLQWDKPLISPYMMTDFQRGRAEVDDPFILYTDKQIENAEDIFPILEAISSKKRRLVVVANDVGGKALEYLVFNHRNIVRNGKRGEFLTLAVRAPYANVSQLEALEDMAALTGGEVISESMGRALPKSAKEVDFAIFGQADKVVSDPMRTIIMGGKGYKKKVKERINEIKEKLKKEEREWEKTKLKERLARLTGEAAILRFGGENESISKEKKYRIEDSINATRNALEEGIVPGGEIALLRASQALEELKLTGGEARGVEIVKQALLQPIDVLARNADNTGNQVIKRVLESNNPNFGWDAAKDEYCDLIERGILDPKKVVKAAVNNAAATTSILLVTEAGIIDAPQVKEEKRKPDYASGTY